MPNKCSSDVDRDPKQPSREPNKHPQSRLFFPPVTDPQATACAVDQVVITWLIPRLLEEYLRQRGVAPKSPFCPSSVLDVHDNLL